MNKGYLSTPLEVIRFSPIDLIRKCNLWKQGTNGTYIATAQKYRQNSLAFTYYSYTKNRQLIDLQNVHFRHFMVGSHFSYIFHINARNALIISCICIFPCICTDLQHTFAPILDVYENMKTHLLSL